MGKNRIKVNGVLYEAIASDEREVRLRDLFDGYDDDELVAAWNAYAEETGDTEIFVNDDDELDMIFKGKDPSYILHRAFNGDYDSQHDYFWFNGYENMVSADSVKRSPESPIDIDAMVEYILDTDDDLNLTDVEDIFNETED